MKKLIILVVAAISAMSVSAIDLSKNVAVYGGVDLASSYMFRADKLAGAAIQPYAGFAFHGADVDWGTFDVGSWASIGESKQYFEEYHKVYHEVDVYGSYIVPGEWVKVGVTYFNYAGYGGWGQQVEVSLEVYGGEKVPLTVGWFTMVYDENDPDKTYATYLSTKYDVYLDHDWTITPEIGIVFGLNGKTIGYVGDQYEVDYDNLQSVYLKNLSVKVDKYWQVHKYVGAHISGFVACNLWDITHREFDYGKNFNIGTVIGFSF